MRLFAALPLSAVATERLSRFRLRQSAPRDGLRWSETEQWHVTLEFFGEVGPEQVNCLIETLQNVMLEAPELRMESFGSFDSKGILFAEVVDTTSLRALHEQCQRVWGICGMARKDRAFRPHITVARTKNKAGTATLKRLTQPDLPSFGPAVCWLPPEILFLESVLRPQGSEYRVVARVPFGREPAPGEP